MTIAELSCQVMADYSNFIVFNLYADTVSVTRVTTRTSCYENSVQAELLWQLCVAMMSWVQQWVDLDVYW